MNPPGDADTDGSPSNCTAFFISTVHDLSLYETHAPRPPPPPPHTRDSLFSPHLPPFPAPLSSLPVQLSLSFHFSVPPSFLILYSCPPSLFLSVFVSILVSVYVSLLLPPPHLPSLTGSLSLVQMCPWSVVAWLGDNRSDFETGGWQPCCP